MNQLTFPAGLIRRLFRLAICLSANLVVSHVEPAEPVQTGPDPEILLRDVSGREYSGTWRSTDQTGWSLGTNTERVTVPTDSVWTVQTTAGSTTQSPANSTDDLAPAAAIEPQPTGSLSEVHTGWRIAEPTGPQLWLAGGDCLHVDPRSMTEEQILVRWNEFIERPPWPISLEQVRYLFLQPPREAREWQQLLGVLNLQPAGSDLLVLNNGDLVSGSLLSLDPNSIEMQGSAGVQRYSRETVRAIRIDPDLIASPKPAPSRISARLSDGSTITLTSFRRIEGQPDLDLTLPWGAVLNLGASELHQCWVIGPQTALLSERTPTRHTQTPYLSRRWPVAINQSTTGGPLRVSGRITPIGLGSHSHSRLDYTLQPGDMAFETTAGLNDWTSGQGNVELKVLLDGVEVWRSGQLVAADGEVRLPRVDLTGKQSLTLVVDYGELADIADHLDWLAPVIFRK